MADKTMPPLPAGSFDLNALLAADDIPAEIARQQGSPVEPVKVEAETVAPVIDGEPESPAPSPAPRTPRGK